MLLTTLILMLQQRRLLHLLRHPNLFQHNSLERKHSYGTLQLLRTEELMQAAVSASRRCGRFHLHCAYALAEIYIAVLQYQIGGILFEAWLGARMKTPARLTLHPKPRMRMTKCSFGFRTQTSMHTHYSGCMITIMIFQWLDCDFWRCWVLETKLTWYVSQFSTSAHRLASAGWATRSYRTQQNRMKQKYFTYRVASASRNLLFVSPLPMGSLTDWLLGELVVECCAPHSCDFRC